MNIEKTIKIDLTSDELSGIKQTLNIVAEICEASEGICDVCPLKSCCCCQENLRKRLYTMYLELMPEEKS
jgi:adenine-specific DNA glycosylase